MTIGDWIESPSHAFNACPSFSWNLFDGGRVPNAIKVENEQTEQALFAYEQTVWVSSPLLEKTLLRRHGRERSYSGGLIGLR